MTYLILKITSCNFLTKLIMRIYYISKDVFCLYSGRGVSKIKDLADADFYSNVYYNSMLAKKRSKPRVKGFGIGGRLVRLEEVLSKLDAKGFKVTQQTLRNYEKKRLIPTPWRGHGGKGHGKITDYAEETPAHVATAFRMINGLIDDSGFKLKTERVAKAREDALNAVESGTAEHLWFASILWLRLVGEFYENDPGRPEVKLMKALENKVMDNFRRYSSPEAIAERAKAIDDLFASIREKESMTPEEKEAQRQRDLEELRRWKLENM